MERQEYQMEELLPIVARLSEKYTSMESSSVTYETARMLMEAVIYCIREQQEEAKDLPSAKRTAVGWDAAYRRGYELVLEKTRRAKALYEAIIEDFQDYGCRNYRDTILKGMPGFFVRYDPRFCPQDHILTLDYPAMSLDTAAKGTEKSGVDLIDAYLTGIQTEQRFLEHFPVGAVTRLLKRLCPDYRSLYLDNLCAPVLLRAAGCAIAGRSVLALELEEEDFRKLEAYFSGGGAESKIKAVIHLLASALPDPAAAPYLEAAAGPFAARIENALMNHSLQYVF